MAIDDVFAVIAEGTRRQILRNLRDGDKAVGELVVELQVSQPTVSKHLKVLREAGLVSMRAQGQKRYYSLDTAPLGLVRDWLADFDTRGGQMPGEGTGEAMAGLPEAIADAVPAAVPEVMPAAVPEAAPAAGSDGGPMEEHVLAAAVLAGPETAAGTDAVRPIGRTMGRAAERAADLLSQLRRRRDPSS